VEDAGPNVVTEQPPGVNFINVLRTAFTKVVRRTLMKSTPEALTQLRFPPESEREVAKAAEIYERTLQLVIISQLFLNNNHHYITFYGNFSTNPYEYFMSKGSRIDGTL